MKRSHSAWQATGKLEVTLDRSCLLETKKCTWDRALFWPYCALPSMCIYRMHINRIHVNRVYIDRMCINRIISFPIYLLAFATAISYWSASWTVQQYMSTALILACIILLFESLFQCEFFITNQALWFRCFPGHCDKTITSAQWVNKNDQIRIGSTFNQIFL